MLKQIQERILENKIKKGFPIKNIPYDLLKIEEELQEFFEEYILDNEVGMGEELADVLIYILGIASYYNIDMDKELSNKLQKVEKRTITVLGNNQFSKEEG